MSPPGLEMVKAFPHMSYIAVSPSEKKYVIKDSFLSMGGIENHTYFFYFFINIVQRYWN